MPGISIDVTSHQLKRRKLGPDRSQVINDEVDRLLAAGSIREIKYPDLVANTFVVKKKNRKWRVYIDFTNLNKACPKDSSPCHTSLG